MSITAKENMLLTERRANSRNANISKCSTSFLKPNLNKSITPLKLTSHDLNSTSSHTTASSTATKGMMKQILALKKENGELQKSLKKLKENSQNEITNYQNIIFNLKSLLSLSSPLIYHYSEDEALKSRIKEALSAKSQFPFEKILNKKSESATKLQENINEMQAKVKDIENRLLNKEIDFEKMKNDYDNCTKENTIFRQYIEFVNINNVKNTEKLENNEHLEKETFFKPELSREKEDNIKIMSKIEKRVVPTFMRTVMLNADF